jgi:hypothetical protein
MKSHGISRLRWDDHIEVSLGEMWSESVDWIALVEDKVQWQAL